jgi:hypothetical protein
MKAKALRIKAIVEFEILLEDFMPSEEDDMLKLVKVQDENASDLLIGECVKVKSGEFENQIYGDILSIESVEKIEVDLEEL